MIVPETFRQGDIIAYVLVNTSFLYAEVHRKGMQLHAACVAVLEHVAQKWEPVLREKTCVNT
jgi:hypothetical protein